MHFLCHPPWWQNHQTHVRLKALTCLRHLPNMRPSLFKKLWIFFLEKFSKCIFCVTHLGDRTIRHMSDSMRHLPNMIYMSWDRQVHLTASNQLPVRTHHTNEACTSIPNLYRYSNAACMMYTCTMYYPNQKYIDTFPILLSTLQLKFSLEILHLRYM
jgi:hypothetical protein